MAMSLATYQERFSPSAIRRRSSALRMGRWSRSGAQRAYDTAVAVAVVRRSGFSASAYA
jgi:hypothetical protein